MIYPTEEELKKGACLPRLSMLTSDLCLGFKDPPNGTQKLYHCFYQKIVLDENGQKSVSCCTEKGPDSGHMVIHFPLAHSLCERSVTWCAGHDCSAIAVPPKGAQA